MKLLRDVDTHIGRSRKRQRWNGRVGWEVEGRRCGVRWEGKLLSIDCLLFYAFYDVEIRGWDVGTHSGRRRAQPGRTYNPVFLLFYLFIYFSKLWCFSFLARLEVLDGMGWGGVEG